LDRREKKHKAQSAKLVSDLKALQNAIYLYKDDNEYLAYVPGNDAFQHWTDTDSATELENNLTAKLVTGGYIPEIPHFAGWPGTTDDVSINVVIKGKDAPGGSYDVVDACVKEGVSSIEEFTSIYEGSILIDVAEESDIVMPDNGLSWNFCYANGGGYGSCYALQGQSPVTNKDYEYCLPF